MTSSGRELGDPAPASDAPRTTLTFLFTDIEGSTRLEQGLGTAVYASIRERQRDILRGAFMTGGGEEEGTEGDSFFVVFRSAHAALCAAADGQRALAAERWPAAAVVRVRMGVHSGEAQRIGGSLVGLDINRAARIAAAAHGGQVLVSATTRALVGESSPAGTHLVDLGEHRLKDLAEPERLYQLAADDLRAEFPPVRSAGVRAAVLPAQLTSFVGRDNELAEAGRLLEQHRLLTLTGPGGTGKTRLAIEIAGVAAEAFADGTWFVPLDAVRDPALVASQIAGAIGLPEAGGRPARDIVIEWLGTKTALLVLDNFEQVIPAAPTVADLLRSVPGLKIVVTSREALRISGEHEYPVPGLPTPPDLGALSALELAKLPAGAREVEPATLSTYESVQLFIERATAVRPDFAVSNDNAAAVAAICARLRGMPLAIELAAARVKLLSPEVILGRLTHQLAALGAGSRDLPERQQTLRGAIAWSYDILDPAGRRLLERLSVFRGGIDLAAAEAVCGPSDELGVDVFDGLSDLVEKSLLRSVDGPEPRFVMLETIREFAAEMLAGREEAGEVHARMGAWFLSVAREAEPQLAGADQRRWLDRLELEHDNLRAALDGYVAAENDECAISLAFALWRFWQKRGHLTEARGRLDAMAAAPWSHRTPARRARLLEALGGVCWWQADIASMRGPYEEAVAIWRAEGDKAELANALYNYSFYYSVADKPAATLFEADPEGIGASALEEALGLYRAVGDERGTGNVLWGLGNKGYFGMAPDAGSGYLAEALETFRRVGDRTMEAWALHMLGIALLRLGRLDESRTMLREALRLFDASSDAAGLTLVIDDLGLQAAADGDAVRSARLWGAARNLTNSTGAALAGFVDQYFEPGASRPTAQLLLSPEELERLAAEGAAMAIDDVVAYALEG
jgi:predicted ATPase/class 3 adenylate cyclase